MSSTTDRIVFERKPATEEADIAEIVRNILWAQAHFAAKDKRPLGRGTHAKGVGVRAVFEVFDVRKTVADPVLASRLARGIFAKPGVYPATARFANASSSVRPDRKNDVRALSFSVTVPAAGASAATRHDFSMNNATTFPINDAHAFAVFVRVKNAPGIMGKLRALLGLRFSDVRGLFRTAINGVRQQRGPVRPYQETRYWSNVPFRHGHDEAVQYSALPGEENEGRPIGRGPNALQDELARHLTEDPHPAPFDFGIQFLDVHSMTCEGQVKDAPFWVENASVEWPEAQAPFHVVGRLRLLAGPLMDAQETDAMFIDVTENSTPDTAPIGGINRARWAAEKASREARLNPAAVGVVAVDSTDERPVPPTLGGRIARSLQARVKVALWAAAIVFALGMGFVIYFDAGGGPLPVERVDEVVYANDGWGMGLLSAPRQTFYYTAQGTSIKGLRYKWLVNLETPLGTDLFAAPGFISRYGFLVDPETPQNPDRLPVGFTRHFDRELNEDVVDVTCAACHTGQLNVTRGGRTTAIRVDGGSALHAFTNSSPGHFVPTLLASMVSTTVNPFKFNRFARKVIGEQWSGRFTLYREMLGVAGALSKAAIHEKWYGLVPTEEGYARIDALARIANAVFGDNLEPINYAAGDAPVSYPPLWNIWKFDWVQYNASVSQPMARNIGETMGTGASYTLMDRYGLPLPSEARFRSSALVDNLDTIEKTLRTLAPPTWPEAILGPVDRQLADRGKALFDTHCVSCHGPHIAPDAIKARNSPGKGPDQPEWLVETVCLDHVGTDPRTAMNFYNATVDVTKAGLTAADLRSIATKDATEWKKRQAVALPLEITRLKAKIAGTPANADAAQAAMDRKQLADYEEELRTLDQYGSQELSQLDPKRLPVGLALSYLGKLVRVRAYEDKGYDMDPVKKDELDGFGALDRPQIVAAYKPRPLAGMWATPPYLHNGSVPTIYDLLSPASDRPKTFIVGSREFDPAHVGLADPVRMGLGDDDDYFVFDTTTAGNSNSGHEFVNGPERTGKIGPGLTPDERLAIIEHLKVRNDDTDGPKEPSLPWTNACTVPAPPAR